jgi:hypothetical protein
VRGRRAGLAGLALAGAIAALASQVIDAHKPVTSKYTYTEDVYPIVSRECGACHSPGGVAPMSLLTYDEARPWAESIRLELASGHMPPWFGDPGVVDLKDPHKLSPRDLDVVLTWVTGGTPRGESLPGDARKASNARGTWRLGRPAMTLQMPSAFSLSAAQAEDTQEFVLETARDRDRFIRAADLLPGNPAIVHDAIIFVRDAGRTHETVLATWLPGSTPVSTAAGIGFPWRTGEQLGVRIHYRKTWKLENKAASDRSTVGLYLSNAPVRDVRRLTWPRQAPFSRRRAGARGCRAAKSGAPADVGVHRSRRPMGPRAIRFGAGGMGSTLLVCASLTLPKARAST